jgi:cytochrome b involved in lipid metabolism
VINVMQFNPQNSPEELPSVLDNIFPTQAQPQIPPADDPENTDETCCFECATHGSVRMDPHTRKYTHVTMCEVKKHTLAPSMWIVSEDKVYDVSAYQKDHKHPGGERAFIKRAGGQMDSKRDYNFHSAKGRAMWNEYHIATLVPCKQQRGSLSVVSSSSEESEGFCVIS